MLVFNITAYGNFRITKYRVTFSDYFLIKYRFHGLKKF